MTTELDNYFKTLPQYPSKGTEASYRSQYKKIYSHFEKNLADIPVSEIKEYLETKIEKINTRKNLLNIFILLKKESNYSDYLELNKLREDYKNEVESALLKTNTKLEEKLSDVSYSDLLNYLERCEGIAYIINYILINFSTRNKDLDLYIVKDLPDDDDENYIQISTDSKSVLYYRNNYKTVRAHGKKTHLIKNVKFVKTCVALLGNADKYKLLRTKQLNPSITAHTYKNLNETEYFKLQVQYYKNQKYSTKKLYEIGINRGTDIDYILKNYNLEYQIRDTD